MTGGVLAFDLSPSLCGWGFAGPGGELCADAFLLPPMGSNLGGIALHLEDMVVTLIDRFLPAQLSYEAPILLRHDSLIDLRRIYGLGMVLEYLAARADIPCGEVDLRQIKNLMTNDPFADKKLVVAAALALGVKLPATDKEGRKDAADALGCALVTLAYTDPLSAAPHIAKLKHRLL